MHTVMIFSPAFAKHTCLFSLPTLVGICRWLKGPDVTSLAPVYNTCRGGTVLFHLNTSNESFP